MDQDDAAGRRGSCQRTYSEGVEVQCVDRVIFRAIDVVVGGAIDDHFRTEALDGVLDRPIVGSIQICVTEGRHIVAGGKCLGYRGAKLATGSNDDDAHYFPPRRRSTESGGAMLHCIIEAILPRADRASQEAGHQISSTALFHRGARLAFGFAPLDGLPLVVFLFPFGETHRDLHSAVLEIHADRHEGHAFFDRLSHELPDFVSVEQQLATAQRFVIGVAPMAVRADVHVIEKRLAIIDLGRSCPED